MVKYPEKSTIIKLFTFGKAADLYLPSWVYFMFFKYRAATLQNDFLQNTYWKYVHVD